MQSLAISITMSCRDSTSTAGAATADAVLLPAPAAVPNTRLIIVMQSDELRWDQVPFEMPMILIYVMICVVTYLACI